MHELGTKIKGNNWQVGPQSTKQSQVRGKWYLVRRTDEISAVRREISSPRVAYKRFLRPAPSHTVNLGCSDKQVTTTV